MTQRNFRISWIAFVLAWVSVVLTFIVLRINDDEVFSWDQINEQITIFFSGTLIAFLFVVVSFLHGLYAWKQQKITLLWLIPGGILISIAVAYFLVYLIGPYWNASWS